MLAKRATASALDIAIAWSCLPRLWPVSGHVGFRQSARPAAAGQSGPHRCLADDHWRRFVPACACDTALGMDSDAAFSAAVDGRLARAIPYRERTPSLWWVARARHAGACAGRGRFGANLARELMRSSKWRLAGLLDDAPDKQRREVHGYKVWGPISELPRWSEALKVKHAIIALPSAPLAV